ncbi:hypothetical protein B0A55_01730 [Friedmanniomyces simplex]|uniref:Autophagy-related protein 2 n=1 Tax=Friedmanniomyces simplex TaxID=329884 RepID=A0A4U0Y1S1_9PEZI|nr:hypothetical protein B0A55_01730 [Friedmanniomyces simplex]
MAWWQKKLLQYGLLRSGLFEDGALDLDDLNITWGRRSVVELKDVALNAKRIGKLARLPPSLRVEVARVLSLRITIPASLYQSGVEVEIDGIELTVKLVNEHEGHGKKREVSTLPPTAAGSPQHRKVHRRLRSPAPGYPDILSGRDDDGQAPTAEELAKSFLLEEPIHDRRALEASVAASRRSLEQSAISDGSDADDVGTGAPVSVPGFLAGFLQGVTDRAQMRIKNVDVKVETEVSGEPQELVPVTLRLRVGSVNVKCVDAAVASDQHFGQRNMEIHDVSLDLLSDAATFSQLSEVQSCSSPDSKRGSDKSPTVASAAADPLQSSRDSNLETSTQASLSDANDELATSMRNTEGHEQTEESLSPADFDIKPGDDNISWGSRRSKESAPVEDLWSSMASEDDLPDSLLLDRAPTPRAPASRSESPAAMRSRRAVSPYDRTLQSPGSWPRLDESPEGQRPQQSPGSWPMPDRSPQSVYQPLTPGPAMEMEDPMDNKRTALIASDADGNNSVAVPRATARPRERDDSPLDEMAESRFYSHEEAESLYMSAMTQGSHPKVPGGWQSKGPLGDHSRSAQNPEDVQIDNSFEGRPVAFKPTGFGQDDVGSGNATPRAQSPPARGHKIKDEHLLSKQLLTVDEVFAEAPISADLATLRLDYQYSPKDPDLERLLSLLTPSRDKYDDDKDILLDTLLRQRKKGALARVSLDDVKIKVGDFECLTELATLGAELSKLSAVTKYLPEDERPGLLSLVRVKNAEAQLPINESFGVLKLAVQEVHCAHVGLPALIALSVDSVKAMRPGHGDLIRPLIPLPAGDILPMLMARMLGDEAEPTVKVKIFNTCFEYSVPTIVALTGSSATDAEGLVADLAQSIADIAVKRVSSEKSSPTSETSRSSSKRTHIDLLVHDSALGLTPDKNSSKGLLVLTDTKFMTLVPADSTMKASLELRKAAIFLMDNQDNKAPELATAIRNAPSNTTTGARLSSVLTKQGYASVGSLMSAKIVTTIDDTGASKSVTVDVSNELLLLETCADSTQTLFAILGGLAPPAPPSKRPKYLTEPMTIEDMMASFTGEPVTETSAPPDTLFDVEEEPGDDPGMLLDPSTLGSRADDLLLESEMTSSLYGPVSGMLGGIDKPDDEVDDNEFLETVESLLEDDPFEMPISPTELGFGDSALTRELAKQCRPASKEQPVDLSIYEIEDLGLDALRGGELGSRHRFNTPTSKRRKLPLSTEKTKLPFRLRLRDTHLIWNLYDGYDWQRTRDGITRGVEQVEARAEERKARRRRSHQVEEDEESVIGDFLFNSIYVGVAATHDAQELRRQINRGIDDLASETESVSMSGMSRPTAYSASGQPLRQQQRRRLKLERSKAHKVAFELKGVSADMLVYPPEVKDVVSDLDLRVRDIDVFDNVPTSTWRKFMTCLNDGTKVREMCKPMAHIEVNTVRTLQDLAASELIIHASVLPLRLHVDQDALDFIVRFFEFKDDRISAPVDPTEQPFIQRLEVDTVDICLDYKPKRIDYGGLRSGHTNELMNMITLDAANIRLRHAIVYGIKGFEPLHKTLNDIWMPDVKRNQLPTVLAGLAPVRGLVNLGSGVRDVIAIPIREYRKDGRIVRSIQKGALHFGKTTTSELARLGAKLAIGTQTILQGAEGLLSPSSASPSGGSRPGTERGVSPSDQTWHDVGAGGGDEVEHEHRAISAYANQPIGVLSGLRSARLHLEHDLLTARDALIAVQGEILESGSPGAAAAAVARYAPTVILRPVIGASRAVGTTLLGVGNQIDRQNMRRMDDKYKRK